MWFQLIFRLFLLTLICIMVRYVYLFIQHKKNNYPPGPFGLPIFGSLLFASNPLKFFKKLYNEYDEIAMFYFGFRPVVLLNSPELSLKVLKYEKCLQREPLASSTVQGVGFTNGKQWHKRRNLGLKCIQSVINSNWYEYIMNQALETELFQKLQFNEQNQCIWHPKQFVHYIGFNSIFIVFFGDKISFNSAEYHEYSKKLIYLMRSSLIMITLNMFLKIKIAFPWIISTHERMKKILLFWIYEYGEYDARIFDKNLSIDSIPINKKLEKFGILSGINQMIMAFKHDKITKEEILEDLSLYFAAGSDSNEHTIEYGFRLLCQYQGVQNLLYDEIYQNIKDDKEIKNEINKLPLTRAFIHEALRLSSIAATGIPRLCTSKINIKGYNIPKNSIIMSNVLAINHDSKYWPNTSIKNKINLQNWLNDKNQFVYNQQLLTFSHGKRDCLGRSLAIRSLYLVFIKIISKYKLNFTKHEINPFEQSFRVVQCLKKDIPIKLTKR